MESPLITRPTSSVKLHSSACKECEKKITAAKHRKCLSRLNTPDEVCPSCREFLCGPCYSLSFCYDLCPACDGMVCKKCGKKCEQLDNTFCEKCFGRLCSRCKYTLASWTHPQIREHMDSLEIYLSDSDDSSGDYSDSSESDEDAHDPHGKKAAEKYKQKLREKLAKKKTTSDISAITKKMDNLNISGTKDKRGKK